jgi:hypothetical protein
MTGLRVELTVVGRQRPTVLAQLRAAGLRKSGTVLEARVRDASALYGVLQRLSSLGIELHSLRVAPPGAPADVEIVVRGPVGPLLELMLADVADQHELGSTELRIEDPDVAQLLDRLGRLATLPGPGDEHPGQGREAEDLAAGRGASPRQPTTEQEGQMEPDITEMGPIDYIVVEFPKNRLDGTAFPLLVDLVERGIIRVLDLAFIQKGEDDQVQGVEIKDLEISGDFDLTIFEGASSSLLGQDDLEEAGAALTPGAAAGILVYENAWAAPFATALRRGGGQLVASGRIPVQAIIAALDAADATDAA